MARPFAAALAPAALLAALAGAPAAAIEAVAETELVMRIGPGAQHRAVASVPAETHLTVHGCVEAEGWCLVRFAGRHGWVPGDPLGVVGFSRPPPAPPAAAPAAVAVTVVTVPVVPYLPPLHLVSAEDVVIGVGERFGLAAFSPHPAKASFRKLGARAGKRLHADRLHFRKFGARAGKRLHADRLHVRKLGARAGKRLHADRLHFRKFGARAGKELRVDRIRFGKAGARFSDRRKSVGHAPSFGKGHSKVRSQTRGRPAGHPAKARFSGLRVKGGWRP